MVVPVIYIIAIVAAMVQGGSCHLHLQPKHCFAEVNLPTLSCKKLFSLFSISVPI